MKNQVVYNTGLKIKPSSLTFNELGINLTICKKIANYSINHPNKQYMMMFTPTVSGLDPLIEMMDDNIKVKRIFKYLSLFTFLLIDTNRNEWIFYYKLVNNKSDKIVISKLNSDKIHITINNAVKKALLVIYNNRESSYKEPELIEMARWK